MVKILELPHHCYIIKNIINNKIYIGVTYKDIKNRFAEHVKVSKSRNIKSKMPINLAIAKYGKNNFTINILKTFTNGKDAYDAEIKYIKDYNSTNSNIGYNASQGGDCGPLKINWDTSTIINVINDYCNNISFKEICQKYNISKHEAFDMTRLRFSKTHNIPKKLLTKLKNKKLFSKKRKKVNPDIVKNIISDFVNLNLTFDQLSKRYNLSPANTWSIVRRKTFKNISIGKELEDLLFNKLNSNRYWSK